MTARIHKDLCEAHLRMLKASDISDEVIEARGYRTVTTRADLAGLGFSPPQRNVPALLVPVIGVTGDLETYQARPDTPRTGSEGKAIKYETPKGSRMALDVHPRARPGLGDPEPYWVSWRLCSHAASLGMACA